VARLPRRAALLAAALADEPANERQARELVAAFARVVHERRGRVLQHVGLAVPAMDESEDT
jgi:hypothetical protein